MSTAIRQTIDVDTLQKNVPEVIVGDLVTLNNGTEWTVTAVNERISLMNEKGKTRLLNGTPNGCYRGGNQLRIERIVRFTTGITDAANVSREGGVKPLKFHKYADLYPLASEEELSRLTEDIKKNGLANPIILIDGEILDGRNRYLACQRAKVEPDFKDWEEVCHSHFDDGTADDEKDNVALLWTVAQNSHRRHLKTSQLAIVAASVAKIFEENAKKRQLAGIKPGGSDLKAILPEGQQGQSSDLAAKTVGGVSGRTVRDAIKIQETSQELADKVFKGELTVNAAKNLLPKAEPNLSPKQAKDASTPKPVSAHPDPLTVAGLLDWFNTVDTIERKKGRWLGFGIFQHRKRDVTVALNFPALDPATAKTIAEYSLTLTRRQPDPEPTPEPAPDPDPSATPAAAPLAAEPQHELPPFALTSPCYASLPPGCKHETDLWTPEDAQAFFDELLKLPWEQHIRNNRPVPRLVCWMGVPPNPQSYTGRTLIVGGGTLKPIAWTPVALTIKKPVEEYTGQTFDSLNINYYRDNKDSVDWHADDADEGLWTASIASVSLGATRALQTRHGWDGKIYPPLELVSGSLFVMPPGFQKDWLHRVAKTSKPCGPRINLTFRRMIPTAQDLVGAA